MKYNKFVSFILLSVIIFSLSSCSSLDKKNQLDKNENENNIITEVAGEKITVSELKFIFGHIRSILEEDANLLGADKEQIKEN